MTKNAPGQGRPRKPLEIHKMNGNPGRRAENAVEPIPVPRDRPEPPEHYDEESAKLWHYFCDAIQSMGVLSSLDAPSLELLVDSWRGYRQTQAHVQEHGYTSTSEKGQGLSQYFVARKTLFQESMKLLTQFGFTPVARASLAGALVGNKPVGDDDPLEALWRKRAERMSG